MCIHHHPPIAALKRIALVAVGTAVLFLTLGAAGLAAAKSTGQPCPGPCYTSVHSEQPLSVPDLAIVKGDANPNVRPGGTLTYRIFYQNLGDEPATGVVITDTLPPYTKHVQNTADPTVWTTIISDTMVVWHSDVISPLTNGVFDVVLKVSEDAPAGAVLVNQAEIATSASEEVFTNNSWTTAETVVRVADVWITKNGPAEVGSGHRITYTIEYGNDGSDVADNVLITDTLPAGVSFLAFDGSITSPPTVDGQSVAWPAGSLSPSARDALTVVGQVSPDQPSYTTLTNSVTISTQTPEKDRPDDGAIWSTDVQAGPPDSVLITVPPTVTVGTSTTFTAEVLDRWANPVADGTPVSFAGDGRVTPDAMASTASGVATATLTAGTDVGLATITGTAGTAVGMGTIEVIPGPVGELRPRPTPGIQTVGHPVTVRSEVLDSYANPVRAGIGVTFSTTLGEIQPPAASTDVSGIVTATLTSTRTGTVFVSAHSRGVEGTAPVLYMPGPTEQVSVTAKPPAIPVDGATSQIGATVTDGYGNPVGDGITVTFASSLGSISPITTTTVAGHVTSVLTSGRVHGQAAVTVTVSAYTGTTAVEIMPADLRIQSTNTPAGEILPGTTMTYVIAYENVGGAVARDVIITNTFPVGLIDISYESSGPTITATQGITQTLWEVDDLAPEAGGTVVLRGRFDPQRQWPSSQFVSNVARIGSSTAEGNPGDNTTGAGNLVVTSNVYIQSAVDDGGTDLRPGGKIKYQVFFGNYDPTSAQGVTITDTLPAWTSLWQENSQELPGLNHVSPDSAAVQVWRYDGPVDGPNFGNFYVWLNIDPQAPGGLLLDNRLEIATDTPEGNYTDNVYEIQRRLEGVNLETRLQAPSTVIAGQMITYTLGYSNTGTLPAEDVVLFGMLPAGLSVIDVSHTPTHVEPGSIEWDLGSLASGQRGQVFVVGRVDTDVEAGRNLHSALTVTTNSSESFTGDNTAEVNTRVVPDEPDNLTLLMEPTTMLVGTGIPVSVTVVDRFGNPIDGLTVTLSTTAGVVTPTVMATVQGSATATFEAPTTPARGSITAVSGALSDVVDFVVEPGPPANLHLETAADELPADGRSTTVIRAAVTDEYGNPVADGTQVTFETDRGTLYSGQARHTVGTLDGLASTVLTTGRSSGPATVSASAGQVSDQVVIEFQPIRLYYIYLPLLGAD